MRSRLLDSPSNRFSQNSKTDDYFEFTNFCSIMFDSVRIRAALIKNSWVGSPPCVNGETRYWYKFSLD